MADAVVNLPIHLVEFGEETSSHVFQVDSKETGGKYDMIIGSNIMMDLGINCIQL